MLAALGRRASILFSYSSLGRGKGTQFQCATEMALSTTIRKFEGQSGVVMGFE